MNKPFYMYMNVQGMGRNVFTCLITIFPVSYTHLTLPTILLV